MHNQQPVFTDQDLLDLVEGIRSDHDFSYEEAEDHAVFLLMAGLDIKKNGAPRHPHIWEFIAAILTAHVRMVGQFRALN